MTRTMLLLPRRSDQPLLLDAIDGITPSEPARIGAAILEPVVEGFQLADLLYAVVLPDGFRIRPADWRFLAYDHEAVGKLISESLAQNAQTLKFEPLSPDLIRNASALFRLALADLVTVFHVQDVTCEDSSDGRLIATASGEHKNGELRSYTVAIDQSL